MGEAFKLLFNPSCFHLEVKIMCSAGETMQSRGRHACRRSRLEVLAMEKGAGTRRHGAAREVGEQGRDAGADKGKCGEMRDQ